MKFKTFLLNEGRSKELTMDDAVALYKKHCKQYKWEDQLVYRGINANPTKPQFVDPSKHTRASANTMNFYTLWIDNSKKWAKYPKRSQSLICTTGIEGARSFGNPFIVVPYDGATIGVCPTDDFWNGFMNDMDKLDQMHLHGFNQLIFAFVSTLMDSHPKADAIGKNFNIFKSWLKKTDNIILNNPDEAKKKMIDEGWDEVFDDVMKYGGLLKMMDTVLDPKPNKFQVMPFTKFKAENFPYKEVWTDSPCLLFPVGQETEDILKESKDFGTQWNGWMDKVGAKRGTVKDMLDI